MSINMPATLQWSAARSYIMNAGRGLGVSAGVLSCCMLRNVALRWVALVAGGLESVAKVPAMLNLMGGNTDTEQRLLLVRRPTSPLPPPPASSAPGISEVLTSA